MLQLVKRYELLGNQAGNEFGIFKFRTHHLHSFSLLMLFYYFKSLAKAQNISVSIYEGRKPACQIDVLGIFLFVQR